MAYSEYMNFTYSVFFMHKGVKIVFNAFSVWLGILIWSDLLLTSIENIFDEKHVMQFDKALIGWYNST